MRECEIPVRAEGFFGDEERLWYPVPGTERYGYLYPVQRGVCGVLRRRRGENQVFVVG